ncbi:hypothetical protein FHS42_002196 [Streptomyces zagrosensis]|uniref:Uncharacterized protein n=1 Tax=Streptomyces zagrosensis TaxID=1042984 RepID=A0A7W9UYA7_9ACTN|nr:hypothetical protein [Streptomyces zagrosensis]
MCPANSGQTTSLFGELTQSGRTTSSLSGPSHLTHTTRSASRQRRTA